MNRAPGKINGLARQETTAPYPVSQWIVDQETPEGDEDAIPTKLHTLSKGSCNQGRGDNGKLALEHSED